MKSIRRIPQILLGVVLIFTGVAHLTTRRIEFQAQVPNQLVEVANFVVISSGIVEVLLGIGLLVAWKFRQTIGWVTAIYLVAVSWGNFTQFFNGTDAFGMDTGVERFVRLLIQPLLIMWVLLSTGAWGSWRTNNHIQA
jgi:uncharacterized membrane protein